MDRHEQAERLIALGCRRHDCPKRNPLDDAEGWALSEWVRKLAETQLSECNDVDSKLIGEPQVDIECCPTCGSPSHHYPGYQTTCADPWHIPPLTVEAALSAVDDRGTWHPSPRDPGPYKLVTPSELAILTAEIERLRELANRAASTALDVAIKRLDDVDKVVAAREPSPELVAVNVTVQTILQSGKPTIAPWARYALVRAWGNFLATPLGKRCVG